jgi:hypothetical protein
MNVTLQLDTEDLSYWNEQQHAWMLENGRVELMVGASSADLRQKETLSIN